MIKSNYLNFHLLVLIHALLEEIDVNFALTFVSSLDGKYMKIFVSGENISGTVTQIEHDNNKIWVDGKEYELCLDKNGSVMTDIGVGDKATSTLTQDYTVVCTDGVITVQNQA